jgi:hypothetical protein
MGDTGLYKGWSVVPRDSLALPTGVDPAQRWRDNVQAYEAFLRSNQLPRSVRPVVRESWRRSAELRVDPDSRRAPIALVDHELDEARQTHQLAPVMPAIHQLLIEDAADAGVMVAVGDAAGRILWVDGDPNLVRRAEAINVTSGAVWTECAAGTNAVGTCLVINDLVQVFGSEHFTRSVHPWSCTAAPIRDPRSLQTTGFLTLVGRDDVASPQSALLIRSVTAAIEAELRWSQPVATRRPDTACFRVLGRDRGELELNGQTSEISLRHSELLFLLSVHPDGLSADELALKMYESDPAEVTVRAEMSRLRKAVPTLLAPSRPYRLQIPLRTDAAEVTDCLRRGAHRRAVELYRGPVLPRSDAPDVADHRNHLHGWLRQTLMRHASAEVILGFARSPSGREDLELLQACMNRLPYGSPRRAEVSAAIHNIDS